MDSDLERYIPSEKEATLYYHGLPSRPRLVARSSAISTPWKEPTGPEAYPEDKELRPVYNHPIGDVWNDKLAPLFIRLLDARGVKFTSIDVLKIWTVGVGSPRDAPVVVWVGVMPGSLSPVDGLAAVLECKKLLQEHGIDDVEVEMRESIVTRGFLAGPRSLDGGFSSDSTVKTEKPPTSATLGHSISSQSTPWATDTAGFVLAEGGGPLKDGTRPRHNVLLGESTIQQLSTSIQTETEKAAITAEYYERRLEVTERSNARGVELEREEARAGLERARAALSELRAFLQEVAEKRVLGHVVYAPPIGADTTPDQFTGDFAVIALEPSTKIDAQNFNGNVIDLGTRFELAGLTAMIDSGFSPDRLLELQGIIPTAELQVRGPTPPDENGAPTLMVLKRGGTTSLTIGRANAVFSCVRNCSDDNLAPQTSREWTVLPYDSKSGPFAAPGDSGAAVVDGCGRIGGMLTSGAGSGSSTFDIAYATPMDFLMQRIVQKFPDAHLYRAVAA